MCASKFDHTIIGRTICILLSLTLLVWFEKTNIFIAADSIAIYPNPTETRDVQSLDGIWHFRTTRETEDGFAEKWYEKSLDSIDDHYERMPVPASFNDITEKREIRDFSGWAWYDRKFFAPKSWNTTGEDSAILLRFGSVNYQASVFLNGAHVVNHTGGHLPFEADVTTELYAGAENRITVAVNNVLSEHTLPPGRTTTKNDTRLGHEGETFVETFPSFDFFPYAGIHRSVHLSRMPKTRITDLTVTTSVEGQTTGIVRYNVTTSGSGGTITVSLRDRSGKVVATNSGTNNGILKVANATLWWPFTMSNIVGYQYTMSIQLYDKNRKTLQDVIYQKVGIRTVKISGTSLWINDKPLYLRGFGKHEDEVIRGRGLAPVTVLKDFNLMKWIGANSFRTSHYPYAEDIMDEADEQGIAVIDEVPAVGLSQFTDVLLAQHLLTIRELIERDKNRASVLMWSIANEPSSGKAESKKYFEKVAAEARKLDPAGRPITAAINIAYRQDLLCPILDVCMINRYNGWYSDAGYTQVIRGYLIRDMMAFYEKFHKPIMISEYGADTIPGLHDDPETVFSEDYQVDLMTQHHSAFDALRGKGFFIGEHIWNFADFMTIQGITRVGGNRKGIFTRDRKPKTSARLLRCRYWNLTDDMHNEHRQGVSLCPSIA